MEHRCRKGDGCLFRRRTSSNHEAVCSRWYEKKTLSFAFGFQIDSDEENRRSFFFAAVGSSMMYGRTEDTRLGKKRDSPSLAAWGREEKKTNLWTVLRIRPYSLLLQITDFYDYMVSGLPFD